MREGFTQQRCPKCGGNIFLCRDLYGWYEQCLQCSHTSYLDIIVDVGADPAEYVVVKADKTG